MAVKVDLFNELPTGSVSAFAGDINDLPKGWLLCDGLEVSRTKWRKLFDVIGTTYGSGDGSTTFNIPDVRARVIVGRNDSQFANTAGEGNISARPLNQDAGEEEHILTIAEMASHSHSYSTQNSQLLFDNNTLGPVWDETSPGTGTTGSTGNDDPHNNMQPFVTMYYIIKG